MLNPKLVPLHKNLPEINDRKDINPTRKGLQPHHNPSFILFDKISEVIINTHTLPIEIIVQDAEGSQTTLLVTASSITAKNKSKSCSAALQSGRQKWLKISLGGEFKRAEVRNKFNENKISKTSIYCNSNTWKNEHSEEKVSLTQYNAETLLDSLRHQDRASLDGKSRGGLRAKFSERANSFSHKESLTRKQERSIHMADEIDSIGSGKKYDSATLNFNAYFQNREKIAKRTANTSNSLRSESNDIKFSKKQQRVIEPIDCRPSYKPSFFQDRSQLLPITQGKARPRFYQQIPLTHQQIELKRKKFDSQFIAKKPEALLNLTKTNQSQVTEQIIKCENSRVAQGLDDTFQQGIDQHRPANQQAEESGTLCESVFE